MMKKAINQASLLLVLAFLTVSANAENSNVDFEHLGEPLRLNILNQRDKSVLNKLRISEDDPGFPGEKTRVIKIAGANSRFVVKHSCNDAQGSGGSWCSIWKFVSLESGRSFTIPLSSDDGFQTSFSDSTGSSSRTLYVKNEKGELLSLIRVESLVKRFKGKEICSNRGSVLDADPRNSNFTVRFSNKSLGDSCFSPSQRAKDALWSPDYEIENNAFFDSLVKKALTN